MTYLRSFAAGLAGALVASLIWILAVFVVPFVLPMVASWFTGSGGAAVATISSGPLLFVALLGFILGFWLSAARYPRSRL